MKFTYRLTPNDTDFAGSIEMQDGKPVAEVYSAKHLQLLSLAPKMRNTLQEAQKIIKAFNMHHTFLDVIDDVLEKSQY